MLYSRAETPANESPLMKWVTHACDEMSDVNWFTSDSLD